MKKSTTVRSLLLCGLSMLLCLSMLAGTTFAWFTDSVESGRNQIVAGNLDVELYNGLDNTANKVTSNTELFEMALWEPGAMVYENLTVANEGTLALKYQLGVNVANATVNANGETLAKVLKVAVVEGGIADGTTREALQQLTTYTSLASFVESGKLEESETETYGIVIWWEPSDIDNEFNMNNENKGEVMSIDIGVKLYATQAVSTDEKDSFDEFYDEDAWMDAMQVLTADDLQAAVENAQPGDKIVVMDDITFDGEFVIPAATASTYSMRSAAGVAINLNGHTLSAASVTTEGVATIVNGTLVLPAEGNVYACDETAISLENVEIVSDGISAYAVRNGSVSLKNVTFVNTATSNPVQNYGGNMTLENVTVAQAGDANTAWYSSAVQIINLLVQDENGKYGITAQAETVINGGTYTGKKAVMISAPGGNVTINGGTFNGSEFAIQADFAPQYYTDGANYTSVITINGGTFNGAIKATPAAKVVIYGGTFSHDPSAYVAEGYSAVLEADGSYNVLPGENTEFVENGLYKDGNTYYVTNADGMLALSTKSATYFSGKTIKLANDIDCTDVAMKKIYIWDPENPTTFDGCGYTIYNLDISTAANSDNQGLFHGTVNVKNLTVDGAWVQGRGYVGVIASTLYGNIENCHVKNAQVFAGYWQAGIMVGQFNGTSIKDCSVVDSEIYAPSAVAAIAGIFTDNNNTDIKFENCVVENCAINQTYSFGADYDVLFGAILGCGNVSGKNYIFNNCVVENTTIRGEASDILCGKANQIWIDGVPVD